MNVPASSSRTDEMVHVKQKHNLMSHKKYERVRGVFGAACIECSQQVAGNFDVLYRLRATCSTPIPVLLAKRRDNQTQKTSLVKYLFLIENRSHY